MPEYVDIHTHKASKKGISIYNAPLFDAWPIVKYTSFGIHPWEIENVKYNEFYPIIDKICKRKLLVAIGEVGLDRAIKTPLELQTEVLVKQLEIAEQHKLPVILHSVRANNDLLFIKKQRKAPIPWVFHGFKGSLQEAKQLVGNQCYLSFGESLLDNPKTQEVLKQTPLENVFFETDDSDEKIETIYKKASEILDICTDDLKSKIHSNFIKIFGK